MWDNNKSVYVVVDVMLFCGRCVYPTIPFLFSTVLSIQMIDKDRWVGERQRGTA